MNRNEPCSTAASGALQARQARRPRASRALAASTLMTLALAACGGGGGGTTPAPLGLVKVTVSDIYGTTVPGATVQGPQGTVVTGAGGTALVPIDTPTGTATLTVSRETFVDKSVAATSTTGRVNEVSVTLDRRTSPAGGSLASRSGVLPAVGNNGQQMSFEIELVVVGGDAQPIENLSAANFALRACSPDAANGRTDCVRGPGADADVAYAATAATPEAATLIAGQPARPYAAALLLDQSGSILQSDPTAARLFSTKTFLSGMGPDDQALLAAFADGPGAIIPTPPLTVYAPFRPQASATSYFPTLDALAPLVGGNTPLYASLDTLRQQLVGETALPPGLAKAVVVFTDGADTQCASPAACQASRAQSILAARQDGVRIFTIGLSNGVDIVALGELANQTGGAMLFADSAEQLLPLYGSAGRLLSLSLPTYRLRWTVQAGTAGAFRSGDTLLGRVQVSAGSATFDVPFVVGIP